VDPSSAQGEYKPLALSLLGSFEATFDDRQLSFATDAARALLAYLAVEAGQPHRREHLATLLWPDQSQSAALTNLRQTLARLRSGLSQAVADNVLSITRQSLEIDPDGVELDTVRFEEFITACAIHSHSDISRCRACIRRLEQACALYHGEFLDGVFSGVSQLFDEWVVIRREQFHQQVLGALHTLANYHESVADYEAMHRYAARQLTLEPWREEAHRQMMLALALRGERTAALNHFEVCRHILAAELGIEANIETRALYERIRDDAFELKMLRAPVHNLPAQLTPFVGREHELVEINALLDDPDLRLLTLVGAGGMGKTRLALETAYQRLNRYVDGVFFVSLAPVASPAAIAAAIATSVGLELTGDIRQALPFALRDKQALLLLDNFEHLLEGANAIVELLEAAPGLQFLVTSRERLTVLGEHAYVVRGMSYGESESREAMPAAAIRLFEQSARRVQPDFVIGNDNLAAVAHICALVDGMPLGLELAAAWADMLPLDEIASEIEQSIDFLSADWKDAPERHRSLRAVFDGSWRSLDEFEQRIFRSLSVFQGGFTREAAQAVAGASLRALARLGHKSLLYQRGGRYEIHELLRQFGAEQLHLSPKERVAVEERHSAYYLTFVAQRQRALDGAEPQQAAGQIQAAVDNIEKAWMSAVQHRWVTALDESAIGLWRFCSLAGASMDVGRLMHLAAERLESYLNQSAVEPAADAPGYERALSKLRAMEAAALVAQGDYDTAILVADHAIALGQTSVGIEGEVFGYLNKGQALVQKAQYGEAQRCLENALSCSQRSTPGGDVDADSLDLIEYLVYLWLGSIATRQSQHARAWEFFRRSLDICRRRGDLRGEIHCFANLGNAARAAHAYSSAREHYEHGLRLARELGYRWGEATTQLELGDVARLQGDPEFARELTERSRMLYREIGDRVREAVSLAYLGRLHVYLGDDASAREYLDRFLYLIEGIDAPFAEDWGCAALAVRHYHAGDAEQALVYARRAVAAAELVGSRVDHADALVIVAQILASMNRLAEASDCYQRALELCDEVDGASEVISARAGLALIVLAQQDRAEALAHIDTILATLAKYPDGCVDQPIAIYLACYRVLDALDDHRTKEVLQAAHRRLVEYADRIKDDTSRRAFLQNVAAHRELQQAYAERLDMTPAGSLRMPPNQ
jgi:predicted ATPase/DNA-binding SARP family transcriptional activator/tetratricopeptide (TPR) repeat protein